MKRTLIAVLLAIAALPAFAIELAGRKIVIPMAGRTQGAYGTEWKTDLILSNLTPNHSKLTLRVEFLHETTEVEVPRYSTVVLRDFGRDRELGMVRVTATTDDARIAARAWIYNHGGGVELGQNVQGVPVDSLPKNALIPSLPIANGNRANFGIANPGGVEALVILDADHQTSKTEKAIRIAPKTSVQFDAATFFETIAEPHAVTIRVTSTEPVYAYGSVIRNASGDPYFVAAEAKREIAPLPPRCEAPAPLITVHQYVAPGWLILFHDRDGLNAHRVTERLAEKYGFTPESVWESALKGFFAEMTPEAVAGLRCEPEVALVDQNQYGLID